MDRVEALTQGYRMTRGLLDAPPLLDLRSEILACCARRSWLEGRRGFRHGDAGFIELQREAQSLAGFAELRADPRLRAIAEELLGRPAIDRQGDVCRVVFPHAPEYTTPPHQDEFYLKRAAPVWTAWIPLADCSKSQGGLAVSPGSGALGVLPHDGECGVDAIPSGCTWEEFDFRAGDVLWVHSFTLHKALHNETDEVRVSVDLRFA
jgi:ectoine hydroxylase-related dioxygenase (phytanoyl-CoA dioxygenase family)